MIEGRKLVVVMPAYNAARTLEKTYAGLPHSIIDDVIVVDDQSRDDTVEVARRLGVHVVSHDRNRGYGGNQKTCYREALARGADIVVMVHPDYQYSPRLCGAMAWMVASGEYDLVLGSRILGTGALEGGMPLWKYIANRGLTFVQNLAIGMKMSEYHTGYRAYSRELLESIAIEANSEDFVFDNQLIAQAVYQRFRVGELSCPTVYARDSSSINFIRSCTYGFGVLYTSLTFRLTRMGLMKGRIFTPRRSATRAASPAA